MNPVQPPSPAPVYHPGYVQQVMVVRQSGLATAALVLGLCTMVTFGATGIPAVVLGILALKDIKARNVPGEGAAITGLVFGGLAVFGWLSWWSLVFIGSII